GMVLAVETPAKKRGRPTEKPSVQARVIDACIEHWTKKQGGDKVALREVKIPEAGTVDLLLLGPGKGTFVVVARSWPHAADLAHVVGQAIGDIAHLIQCAPAGARALLDESGGTIDPAVARKVGPRVIEDAKSGELGIVFAIGSEDQDGEEPVQRRL